MATLTLPQLVAGRELADAAVRRLGPVAGEDVVVDARALVSGTPSFAAQLVHTALIDAQAGSLTLVGGPDDVRADAHAAAERLGAADRLRLTSGPVSAASGAVLPVRGGRAGACSPFAACRQPVGAPQRRADEPVQIVEGALLRRRVLLLADQAAPGQVDPTGERRPHRAVVDPRARHLQASAG